MSSLPTLPHRTWLERLSTVLAGGLIVVGLFTMSGWWLRRSELLQPLPDIPVLKINAALAFTVLGAVLLAFEFGRRSAGRFALIPAVLGLLTLVQYILGRDFGIDQILAEDHLIVETRYPGRMSPGVALALMIASIPLVWRTWSFAVRARLITEAVVGSTLAAIGLATVLGYVAALPVVYTWGTGTAIAPVAAVALILAGLALVALAWRATIKHEGEVPAWSPIPIIIGCLSLTVLLWLGLRDREDAYLRRTTQNYADALALSLRREFNERLNVLALLARGRGNVPADATVTWLATSANEIGPALSEGFVSLSFVAPDGQTRWIHPAAGNEGALGFNHLAAGGARADALADARTTGRAVVSATTRVFLASTGTFQPGAVVYAPVSTDGQLAGYLACEYAYQPWFETFVVALKLNGLYHVEFAVAGQTVFASGTAGQIRRDLRAERTLSVAQRRVQIVLTPADAALTAERRHLPEIALAAGVGITLLLGLSVHLARTARAGQRSAELSNRRLHAENEERRRIEARLKVSDERLRLALDSTHIGIFEWSVAAGHVYYSPGLWSMLGYDHGRMPSTVEAWQSLIHPDDLPLYRRRIESQLNGSASFIEPEHRVRANGGEWRWIYTRSKAVATSPDGRPTRIIGTVQDITARREAELALRESQAEARKLSLVAAKTDNPVLIGSPDGRIEWANEAFCRVLEYSLDEVIGRDPMNFVAGHETSPRTVARIRTAIAHGQGISTDIVVYSKSGRKYHLHIEIQPVHDAGGEVINFIAVGTDITARVETEHQLRRAKTEADEASRAKSEFLASMSHEIRTPMNGVIGMTSLLMETTLTGEQRDFVNTIRTSGEALLTIINDILDFSKIESGKMEIERAPFELSACLEEALDLFALQASAKHVELVYHVARDVPSWLMGDVTRLRQVIVNLVNNAVKFTPAGSIAVEVRRILRDRIPGDAGRLLLEFTVRDTGIGIPPDRVDRLFKAFTQLDSSTTRKYGGTGLGLAICRRLCELMGGSIRVESRVGVGSAFTFTIQTELAPGASEFSEMPPLPLALRAMPVLCIEDHPTAQARLRTIFESWGASCVVAPDAAAALAMVPALPQMPALLVVDAGDFADPSPLESLGGIPGPRLLMYPFGQMLPPDAGNQVAGISKPLRTTAFLQAVVSLFQSSAGAGTDAGQSAEKPVGDEIPLEVLLAEDNAVNQKVALRFLQRLGYRARAVGNGREAVAAVENRRYDLVLMDLQMPDMDGIEATRQIRARLPADRQPKIIALTANAMQGDREMCVAAGMDDHISKPVQLHEIAAAIRRHFGRPGEKPAGEKLIG